MCPLGAAFAFVEGFTVGFCFRTCTVTAYGDVSGKTLVILAVVGTSAYYTMDTADRFC